MHGLPFVKADGDYWRGTSTQSVWVPPTSTFPEGSITLTPGPTFSSARIPFSWGIGT